MSRIDNITSQKMANASLFAMAMVVAIHTAGRESTTIEGNSALWWFEAIGHYGVFRIAVPFFFICSGYFLAGHMEECGWWRREFLKRMRTLLVPYIVWSLVYALLPLTAFFIANLIHGRIAFLEQYASIRFWVNALGLNPFAWPQLVPLWYVRALLLFVAISPLLRYFMKKSKWWWLIVLWLLSLWTGIYGWHSQDRLYLMLTKCFNVSGLFYFCCGIYARLNNISLPKSGHALSLAYGLACAMASGYCHMAGIKCVFPLWVPLLLFGLWKFVPERPLPKWLIGSSFAIYVFHMVVYRCWGIAFNFTVENIPEWIAKFIMGVGGSLLIVVVLRNSSPKFASFLFGGR